MEQANHITYTQKELNRIPLFRNMRKINGQKAFKQLCSVCRVTQYQKQSNDDWLSQKLHFIYVKEGEIFVYKISGHKKQDRSLIRSYRSEQYCGFQDYPLFWNEKIAVTVSSKTIILTLPIKYFYNLFRRVIPMTYLQSKAEYLKRLPLFRGIELEKIFKLACLSHKLRVQKGQTFMREGEDIKDVYIISNGKVELRSSMIKQEIMIGMNEDFLVKQIKEGIEICLFSAISMVETDLIAIPKQQFKMVFDIRSQLNESIQKQLQNQPEVSSIQEDNKNREEDEREIQEDFTHFFNQNTNGIAEKIDKFRSKTLYSKPFNSRSKTEKSITDDRFERKAFTKSTFYQKPSLDIPNSKKQTYQSERPYSMGQIQLMKFMKRKQKTQNKTFFRYIQSRAPEIVINPSKQFALVKPLYKANSQYVRNMKRKIKQSSFCKNGSLQPKPHLNNFMI